MYVGGDLLSSIRELIPRLLNRFKLNSGLNPTAGKRSHRTVFFFRLSSPIPFIHNIIATQMGGYDFGAGDLT